MRTCLLLAFFASSTLAREEGLFRGASVTDVQDLYGNSCPQRLEECQRALLSITSAASPNSIQENTMITETPSFDFLQTMAKDPDVWSKIRKLQHMAVNLERWSPDRLDLSIRKLLRLAHALSQFLSETWNVSLSVPVKLLERLATNQKHHPDAFFVATYLRVFLQDTIKSIVTAALVPDADTACEMQTWTCQYHRTLSTVLPQLDDSQNALPSEA